MQWDLIQLTTVFRSPFMKLSRPCTNKAEHSAFSEEEIMHHLFKNIFCALALIFRLRACRAEHTRSAQCYEARFNGFWFPMDFQFRHMHSFVCAWGFAQARFQNLLWVMMVILREEVCFSTHLYQLCDSKQSGEWCSCPYGLLWSVGTFLVAVVVLSLFNPWTRKSEFKFLEREHHILPFCVLRLPVLGVPVTQLSASRMWERLKPARGTFNVFAASTVWKCVLKLTTIFSCCLSPLLNSCGFMQAHAGVFSAHIRETLPSLGVKERKTCVSSVGMKTRVFFFSYISGPYSLLCFVSVRHKRWCVLRNTFTSASRNQYMNIGTSRLPLSLHRQ